MKIRSLTCPLCGANLNIEEGRKTIYCSYCGAKLLLDDDSIKITLENIDHAKLHAVDANERLRNKELDLKNKQIEQDYALRRDQLDLEAEQLRRKNRKASGYKVGLILIAIAILLPIISGSLESVEVDFLQEVGRTGFFVSIFFSPILLLAGIILIFVQRHRDSK